MTFSSKDVFQKHVLEWYRENGRTFYWREEELSAFQILILEMLLKRTRAKTVDKFSAEITGELSSPEKIVKMNKEELVSMIQPLGLYNRRSKNIKEVSATIIDEYGGEVPDSREELMSITGIGEYIADAVLCFGFNRPVLVLDSNVARVANHYFDLEIPSDLRQDNEIRRTLEPYVPEDNPKEFNWSLIDIGNILRKESRDPLELN